MADAAPALTANGVRKRYSRDVWALRDVDLAIPSGSIVALVGPNGAGKSTLIRSWIGFEPLTAGSVSVGGIDPARDRGGVIRVVGYVPQATSLYRDLTVNDHLDLAASLRPGFDRTMAVGRVEDLGIRFHARVRELSGGQQAQVALALALGTRARVYLLDEPLASLDPLARREFLHVLVGAVRQAGATAVLSSHVITDVQQACDRLIVLEDGRKLYDDSIVAALAQHRIMDVPPDETSSNPATAGLDNGHAGTWREVAVFPGPSGEHQRLVAMNGDQQTDPAPDRAASLEEIVLGYLASGRRPVVHPGRA